MNVTPSSTTRSFRFGLFEADLSAIELRKRGIRLRLPERSFRILAVLLERPGQLITREELYNQLWRDATFVDFDHGLNNAVMQLREVLCDSAANPRYIETVHRRGYRFLAPVEEVLAPPERPASIAHEEAAPLAILPAKAGKHRKPWLAQVGLVSSTLVLIAASLFFLPQVRALVSRLFAGRPQSMSLVVLPLENLSGELNQDYFADGMTDELIANLAKIRSLRVIARSTAMAYKGTRKSISEIARELKVDAVVEGTVLRVGDRVRITAELVQVSTDRHLWADTYESQMGDILALQNRVSTAIANEIRINVTPEEKQRLEKKPHVRPEAYENYLKGKYFWNRRSAEKLGSAIRYFEEAIAEDPQYTLAYAALADCYGIVSATIFGTISPEEAAPKARKAAMRALELDPASAAAETALATVKFNYDWDWAGADAGFRRAISVDPNYGTAYQRYSLYLTAMGRFDNSFEQINKARQIDPLSLSINFSLGWRLYMARRYDAAITQLRNTLDMDSTYELPHLVLGQAYEQMGNHREAIAELQKAAELARNTPLTVAGLARGYALGGHRAEGIKLLGTLIEEARREYVSPYYVASLYAALGNNKEALAWLERAYLQRANGLVFLKVDPEWDGLRFSPEFMDLERKLRLPS